MRAKTLMPALFVIQTVTTVAGAQMANLPAPPDGYDEMSSVPHGEITQPAINYPTRNNGMMPVRVYTPPSYTEDKQYPALYLLHGIGGDENEWYNQGAPHYILDNLIAENKLKQDFILVLPRAWTGSSSSKDFDGFEDVLLNDLIPYMEANYSIIPDKNARALAGLSMGGGQTIKFGFGNPDVFTHLGIFSPAPNSPGNPADAFEDLAATKANSKLIYLSCGAVEQPYRDTCEKYDEYMTEQGVEHMFQIESDPDDDAVDDHTMQNWKRGLYNFSQRIFEDSASPGGSGGTGGGGGTGVGGGAGAGLGGSGGAGQTAGAPPSGMAGGTLGGGSSGGAAGSGALPIGGTQAGSTTNPGTGAPPADSSCAFSLASTRSSWALSLGLAAVGLSLLRSCRRHRGRSARPGGRG
jgi:enterochelin esterase-like enzyme